MRDFLTRRECSAMRGIAILGIMLHNYCHWLNGIVRENEYTWTASNNSQMLDALLHPDALLPVHLLSFFGHYGVPVFLFLSGFGLVMKYERGMEGSKVPVLPFVRYSYLKLLRLLVVGFVLFLMVDVVTPGRFQYHWDNVIAQLLMYINVLPEPDEIIWPGIYWFFGLMLQLYLIYRLLLYRQKSLYVVLLIAACWLLQAFCDPDGETLNRLRYNSIGGVLPFGLGILFGRVSCLETKCFLPGNKVFLTGKLQDKSLQKLAYVLMALVSAYFAVAMGCAFQAWLWIPVLIILGTIAVVKAMPGWMLKVYVWFGSISAAMFVTHPIARKLFITVGWKQDIYDGLVVYTLVAIALSWAVKQLIDRIPKPAL